METGEMEVNQQPATTWRLAPRHVHLCTDGDSICEIDIALIRKRAPNLERIITRHTFPINTKSRIVFALVDLGSAKENDVRFLGEWLDGADIDSALEWLENSPNEDWSAAFAKALTFVEEFQPELVNLRDELVDFFVDKLRELGTEDRSATVVEIHKSVKPHKHVRDTRNNKFWADMAMFSKTDVAEMRAAVGRKVMSMLQDCRVAGSFDSLPSDPFSSDFDDYCRYHRHYEGICYRTIES